MKKAAIIFKSKTGNIRKIAEAIQSALKQEDQEIVYFGEP